MDWHSSVYSSNCCRYAMVHLNQFDENVKKTRWTWNERKSFFFLVICMYVGSVYDFYFRFITSTQWHEEIKYSPCQNNDVVHVHPARHNRCSVSNTWHADKFKEKDLCVSKRKRHSNEIPFGIRNFMWTESHSHDSVILHISLWRALSTFYDFSYLRLLCHPPSILRDNKNESINVQITKSRDAFCSNWTAHILPLNIGAILNTPKPPMVNICPNANSMKNIGMPANISVKKYGTKNAPPPFL